LANDFPVILVHGLFGWGPSEVAEFPYWGTGRSVPSPLRRREASVGPISSLHDRACELAFQIRGGRVDYGEAHAGEFGHARFGRTYDGGAAFHPEWSADRPVHLVGHSMGGPTAFLLQQLLAEDDFGWGSNERWVASISSISGVLNGSTATYFLGCDETTGLLDEDGAAAFLGRGIELVLRATGGLFDRFYDFDLDHWGIAARAGEPLVDYLPRIAGSRMFAGRDNGAFSLTIQSLLDQNARCVTYPDTYYFSYVTEQTTSGFLTAHAYPEPDMNPFIIPISLYIGRKQFARAFYPGFHSDDWWPNDGLVSVYSQMYPRSAGNHPVGGVIDAETGFEPGAWYYRLLDDVDHIDVVALPQLDQVGWQKRFYRSLFARLAAL
jgi:triacylglycerol esterase/lipase EstA (alpha/beta hydrolase family)